MDRAYIRTTAAGLLSVVLVGCAITGPLERRRAAALLTQLSSAERQRQQTDYRPQVVKLRRDSTTFYLAPVDTLDGERVMSLRIEQVDVVASMRALPERLGKVTIDFLVTLPRELLGRSRSVVITPILHKPDGEHPLEDLVIRGGRFSLLQRRDYWQYETYVGRFRPDTIARQIAFNRFVKFPYPEDTRLDSVVERRGVMRYYYSQEVPTDETSKQMKITLLGMVEGLDESAYLMPPSDTLLYSVSSMLAFVDTLTRYRTRIVDKYVTVADRNYIQFYVGDSRLVDSLGDNRSQLGKIESLMRRIVEQQEFHVDGIILTAAASPEGSYAANERLARGRAEALRRRLAERFGRQVDTLLTVRWIAEDWQELAAYVRADRTLTRRNDILELIGRVRDPDRREAVLRRRFPREYAHLKEQVYPLLRAVSFRYDLRRKGMVKDTIHTTEPDTLYARGVKLLRRRQYARALYILDGYADRNAVVAHLSMGHDARALELLEALSADAVTEYLRAIACSRLGRKEEGREHFLEACRRDSRMEYRGNLDPEINELLKR